MKTILAIGLAPSKHQALMKHLTSCFRVIMFRGNRGWDVGNGAITYAEDILGDAINSFPEEEYQRELSALLSHAETALSSLLQNAEDYRLSDADRTALESRARQAFVSGQVMRKLAEAVHIDLLLSNADYSGLRRPLVLEAKKLGIKTFCIDHGFAGPWPEIDAYDEGYPPTAYHISDYFNVDNYLEKEILDPYENRPGKHAVNITVYGTPHDITADATLKREHAIGQLGLDPDKFTVTLAGSWAFAITPTGVIQGQIDQVEFYKNSISSLGTMPENDRIQVIIKVHPALGAQPMFDEGVRYLSKLIEQSGIKPVMVTYQNLREVLSASDLIVCPNHSSVLWEAMMLETPGLVYLADSIAENRFNRSKLNTSNQLYRRGCLKHVFTQDDLAASVRHYLNPDNMKAYKATVREVLDELDIKNEAADAKSKRICDALAEILGESTPKQEAAAVSESQSAQPASYYSHARPEVQALVPDSARTILDVGCASGALGKALKTGHGREVTGIELDPAAADVAAKVLDKVYTGTVEQALPDLPDSYFDCIVMADVLEHLADPQAILTGLRAKLAPGGRFVISIPNVRHWSVMRDLLEGRWHYEDAGLLDRTHLRFFTRKSFESLLDSVDLRPADVSATSLRNDTGIPEGIVNSLASSSVDVSTLANESRIYQFLYVAEPIDVAALNALTSIIILTRNSQDYTRKCIESIQRHTPEPHEIIIVDNGSTDGTVKYLKNLESTLSNCHVILNAQNRGYAAGNNQGIAAATGDRVLLLNNDVIVTPGWLSKLVRCLERNPETGVVGPVTNSISGVQCLKEVGYNTSTQEGLDQFAQRWSAKFSGESQPYWRVVGFCMLIRKALIDKIGGLDERFGMGNFEDDDFCVRAAIAGYQSAIARDCFVHHFGSVTFSAQKVDYNSHMNSNWEIFKNKWRIPASARLGTPVDLSGLVNQPFNTKLHYCPINENNADEIESEVLFLAPDWKDLKTWQSVLDSYMRFHKAGDGSLLQLYAGLETGLSLEEAYQHIAAFLESRSIDTENCPDIDVVDELPDNTAKIVLAGGPLDEEFRTNYSDRCIEVNAAKAAA